ncbi:polymorphic toxin type 15 domain-containing protein [Peribacillus frigoritolerans]|uniref:polymorphic toxin type 15 domain-containing protein n=1 Tax=Peribacillus frigoritolerans TaxID=450367 RepID=UPI00330673C5
MNRLLYIIQIKLRVAIHLILVEWEKRVNSSLGSQWRYRIDVIDEQIKSIAASMTEVDKNQYT